MRYSGFTLIELVVFIIILTAGIGVLIPLLTTARHIHSINLQTIANNLAAQRMELILGQKAIVGFDSFTDPCDQGSPPAACALPAPPANYAVSATITNNGDNTKTISVTVSGDANASLTTLVAKY